MTAFDKPLDRSVARVLVCLSLVLAVLPLTHHKPGTPPTLKGDEPAYYLAALSLVRDFDLRCEPHDLERLFVEYPYTVVHNLILSTDDGWHTVYYGKPYLFSFLAAPFAAIFGANGLVMFNSLLLVAMIWMGTHVLRRHNSDGLAALFAVGFFLMSTTYRYVYWLQPEILNMFSTAGCLYFGLHAFRPGASSSGRFFRDPNVLALVASASILAMGVYNKPMMAAIGVPVCFRLLRLRCWRELGIWLLAAAVSIATYAGICWAFTGHPTSYLGVDRQGYNIHTPYEMPMEPDPPPPPAKRGGEPQPEIGKETAGWWWIFQPPILTWAELSEDLRYFFIGRHTGLFLYQPFSLICLILFALYSRRSAEHWIVLLSLVVIGLFFLVQISHNWHGGGGFVGNRYYFMVYPGFLFLVTRIRPDWIVVPGFALGGLFLGALILSPFGLVVPSPTLQANVRNHPFQYFPLEHSLREIPGYWQVVREDVYFQARKDHVRVVGEELWVTGAEDTELWLSSTEPLTELVFEVSSQAPANEVVFRVEGSEARVMAREERQRVVLKPQQPTMRRKDRNRYEWEKLLDIYVYRLEVRTARGEKPSWRDRGEQFFYLGCRLRFLGDGTVERLEADTPE